jgi:NADPH:quinone reductase-like Zn-dependent oxidoreductase
VRFCEGLGATGINYHDEDFSRIVALETAGRGADVILDIVGGEYLQRNIDTLAQDGTVVIIANQSGAPGSFDIGTLMRKRGRILATTLRARPIEERAAIIAEVTEFVMPLFVNGAVHTVTDSTFTLENAADAHRRMESSAHSGKILLVAEGQLA